MARVITNIVEEIGPMKVLGICTDNAAYMKKAWDILGDQFPNIHIYGCLAHTLHLMFSDISKIKSAETLLSECSNIAKTIKASQKLSALFNKNQNSQKTKQTLKLPVKTR